MEPRLSSDFNHSHVLATRASDLSQELTQHAEASAQHHCNWILIHYFSPLTNWTRKTKTNVCGRSRRQKKATSSELDDARLRFCSGSGRSGSSGGGGSLGLAPAAQVDISCCKSKASQVHSIQQREEERTAAAAFVGLCFRRLQWQRWCRR